LLKRHLADKYTKLITGAALPDFLAAAHESAIGRKRALTIAPHMSAIGPERTSF